MKRDGTGKSEEPSIRGRFVLRFSLVAIAVFAVVMAVGYIGWYFASM